MNARLSLLSPCRLVGEGKDVTPFNQSSSWMVELYLILHRINDGMDMSSFSFVHYYMVEYFVYTLLSITYS